MWQKFFDTTERRGETKNLLDTFKAAFTSIGSNLGNNCFVPEEYPLYSAIKNRIAGNQSSTKKKDLTCDEAFAEYCIQVAKFSSPEYFYTVAKTVVAYRECLNKFGWEKLFDNHENEEVKAESPDSPRITTCLSSSSEQQEKMKDIYCAVNDPDRAPEVANEFVILFIKDHDISVAEEEAIELIINMCEWLYTNEYTRTQMVKIKNNILS